MLRRLIERHFVCLAMLLPCLGATVVVAQISDGGAGYSPGGSGTVAQYAERVYNVQATYGATGDGTTDDTAAINLAVADASAAGGGIVFFPAGTYRAQGINLAIGVSFAGSGTAKSLEDGAQSTGVSKIIALASPTAATPIFRFPKGTAFDAGAESLYLGGEFSDLMISGGLDSEATATPSAAPASLLVGIDLRTWQKQTCTFDGSGGAGDSEITATAHGLAAGDEVQFDFATTATAPTLSVGGTFYSNFTYTVLASGLTADKFKIELSDGTDLNFSSGGTGTFYVGKALFGIREATINRCTIRNCGIGIRGTYSYDNYRISDSRIVANWIGILGEEHPQVTACHFEYNKCAISGRLLDGAIIFNTIGGDYGIAPFGADGPWGSTFGTDDATRLTSISTCNVMGNTLYGNQVLAMAVTNGCVVVNNMIVSSSAYTSSVGLRVNGAYNTIVGNIFGEGTPTVSFAKCAIAMDCNGAGGGNENLGTNISYNTFRLSGCPAIQNTDIAGGVYGTYSTPKSYWTVNGNTFATVGDRLVDYRPGGATMSSFTCCHNKIVSTGVAGTMGAAGGFIEAALNTDCIVSDNTVVSAAAGQFVLKSLLVAPTGQFIGNLSPSSTEVLSFAASPVDAIVSYNRPSLLNSRAVKKAYAAGTVYTLTNAQAKVDFGTTDPGVTLTGVGTWRLRAGGTFKYNAATFAASQTFTVVIRRTNNTAANITNATITHNLRVITTGTDGFTFYLPEVLYAGTATGGDTIELQASVSAAPSAGSAEITEAWIVAERE